MNMLRVIITKLKRFFEIYQEVSESKFRAAIYKDYRYQEDLFMLLCFSEAMGLPNPISFYTLELYPEFYHEFHHWHKRMGMEKSPIDGVRCC